MSGGQGEGVTALRGYGGWPGPGPNLPGGYSLEESESQFNSISFRLKVGHHWECSCCKLLLRERGSSDKIILLVSLSLPTNEFRKESRKTSPKS